MGDNIEIVDRNYANSMPVKPSRQIRTRETSHKKIQSAFDKVRIALLEYELNHQKTLAVTDNYVGSKETIEKKVDARVRKIAELEKEIKVLSLEEVPKNYVNDRAIKLRESMMSHLRSYVGLMYMVGLGKESEVFDNVPEPTGTEVVEQIANEASEEIGTVSHDTVSNKAEDENSYSGDDYIIIEPSNFNSGDTRNRINGAFREAYNNLPKSNSNSSKNNVRDTLDESFVNVDNYSIENEDGIRNMINDAFSKYEHDDSISQVGNAVPVYEFAMPYDDRFSTVVDEDLMPYDNRLSTVVDEDLMPYDNSLSTVFDDTNSENRIVNDFKNAIRDCVKPPKYNNTNALSKEDIEAIKNDVRDAFNHYDSNLRKTIRDPKYNYVPMTDSEINKARAEIGGNSVYSKVGVFVPVEKVKNASSDDVRVEGPALRDDIIVVPERSIPSNTKNINKESQFNNIDVYQDASQVISKKSGSCDSKKLRILREKISELQSANEAARRNAIEAEERFQEADKKSRQSRKAYVEKAAALEKKYEEYAAALTNSINSFDNNARLANEAAAMEERFIMAQQSKNVELDDEIAVVSGYTI